MSKYFPPTAYERLPDYGDNHAGPEIPLQPQSPQNVQQQRLGLLTQPTQYSPHLPQAPCPPFPRQETTNYQPPVNKQLRHQYRRIKQFRRISLNIFGRWLLSCLLAATTVGIFILYQHKGALNRTEKHLFNVLYLGVSLMYGLNLVVGTLCVWWRPVLMG